MATKVLSYKKPLQFLDTVDTTKIAQYEQYFQTLMPSTPEDIFRRALFAFASVHTTWQLNCRLYEHLYDLTWIADKSMLMTKLRLSGAGLHNMRCRFLWKFNQEYWTDPEKWARQLDEPWPAYRQRLQDSITGLGKAKSAFFVELVYFHKALVVCFDVHQLRLYNVAETGSQRVMARAEQHWIDACLERNIAPVTARWLYFDQARGQTDSSYWAKTLIQKAA